MLLIFEGGVTEQYLPCRLHMYPILPATKSVRSPSEQKILDAYIRSPALQKFKDVPPGGELDEGLTAQHLAELALVLGTLSFSPFFFLSLSRYLFAPPPVCLSVCIFVIFLSLCLSLCLSVFFSVSLSLSLSLCLSVPFCFSVLFLSLSVCLSLSLLASRKKHPALKRNSKGLARGGSVWCVVWCSVVWCGVM